MQTDEARAGVDALFEMSGEDLPEQRIRQRIDASRVNLLTLVPHLTELKVFDNSVEAPGDFSSWDTLQQLLLERFALRRRRALDGGSVAPATHIPPGRVNSSSNVRNTLFAITPRTRR